MHCDLAITLITYLSTGLRRNVPGTTPGIRADAGGAISKPLTRLLHTKSNQNSVQCVWKAIIYTKITMQSNNYQNEKSLFGYTIKKLICHENKSKIRWTNLFHTDEIYNIRNFQLLGQRTPPPWTSNPKAHLCRLQPMMLTWNTCKYGKWSRSPMCISML